MENYEFPFFGSSDWEKEAEKKQQEYLENLLKNPPQPVNFTYTLDNLKNIVNNFIPEPIKEDNTPAPRIIEDYYDEWYENHKDDYDYGNADAVIRSVYRFYESNDKNDLSQIKNICDIISENRTSKTQLPPEIKKAISEIYEQRKYLEDMKIIDDYNKEQALKTEKENIRIQEEQQQLEQQQVQQARYNEIQSKLPIINEQLDRIRELPKNTDIYETRKNELLRERLYFYHKVNRSANDIISGTKNEITQEDMDRLNNYMATLDSIEQEIVNSNKQVGQQEQVQEHEFSIPETLQQSYVQEQEQINQLKGQIQQYDNQISFLLASIEPYMQIPAVNRQMTQVIDKNNAVNSMGIIDSLSDYRNLVEIKQSLVEYLEKADKFIKDNVENKQQEQVVEQHQQTQQQQPNNQVSEEDIWAWMDSPQQINPEQQNQTQQSYEELMAEFDVPQQNQQTQQPISDNLWDEFDKHDPNVRPERIYNDDGTYTMEYIAHAANTPLGFDQTIYDQLMQANYEKRHPNNNQMTANQQADAMIQAMINGQLDGNGQPIVQNQDEIINGRQMGFAKVWILSIITIIVSIGIIALGIILTK